MRARAPTGPLVWVTRTRPGADATAARLRDLGFEPLVGPLLEVRPIPGAVVDLAGAAAIAFTSANAVAGFAALSAERRLPAFAVGETTAAAARAAGFASVTSAHGDVAALAAALAARRGELAGPILYPAAAEPAQDLAAMLAPAGLGVRQVAVYETVCVDPSPPLLRRLPMIDAVLLHSPKAARTLAAMLAAHPAPHLAAYCLSEPVARALAGADLAQVRVAAEPNEPSLLALLTKPPHG